MDRIIRFDRHSELPYPIWVREPMHLERETTGPLSLALSRIGAEFSSLRKRRVEQEFKSWCVGDSIDSCLGFREGLALTRQITTSEFRSRFNCELLFLFRGAVRSFDEGKIRVPVLAVDKWELDGQGKVVVWWHSLTTAFLPTYATARIRAHS